MHIWEIKWHFSQPAPVAPLEHSRAAARGLLLALPAQGKKMVAGDQFPTRVGSILHRWDFSVSDGGGRGGGVREAEGGGGGAPEKPPAEHLPHPAGRPPEPKGHGAAGRRLAPLLPRARVPRLYDLPGIYVQLLAHRAIISQYVQAGLFRSGRK